MIVADGMERERVVGILYGLEKTAPTLGQKIEWGRLADWAKKATGSDIRNGAKR